MNPKATTGKFPVLAVFRRGIEEAGIPNQGGRDGSPVCQVNANRLPGEADADDAGASASRAIRARSQDCWHSTSLKLRKRTLHHTHGIQNWHLADRIVATLYARRGREARVKRVRKRSVERSRCADREVETKVREISDELEGGLNIEDEIFS
jgi:hypothetical protein